MVQLSYRRHRFPPAVIQHAIWLYLRFTLSYRDVEDLLVERGLEVSYETVRRWVLKFRPLDRAQAAAAPSTPERPVASRRDGGPDRRLAHVSMASR
jgi:transposase-like protein